MTERGSLPLHIQIVELLIRDIAAGRLIDGEKLPPERDLAAQLGIAVGTLRKALAALVERGLLARVQGSGNFVQAKESPGSVYSLFRLELVAGGGLPTARILHIDRMTKDPTLPPLGTTPDAFRIRRLRLLSGLPAAIEEIWLDAGYAVDLRPEDISESLYLYYRRKLGLWISRVEDRIGQGPLPDWAPDEFPVRKGVPLPLVTRVGYGQDGRAAEASRTWYDPATTRYVARFS
ncbi:MAG: GntR family transcriptional regulator [Cypionkella sp.]